MKLAENFFRKFSTILLSAIFLSGLLPAQETNKPVAEIPTVAKWPGDEQLAGKGPFNKSAWFQKTWVARRTEFWNNREKDKGAVVFLGDSITQGWGTLSKDFPNLKVANRGISGDTTRGVLFRLQEDVLDLKPAAVVLLIGTNDIGIGGEPEDAAANIKVILAAMKKSNPKMSVIVCKVMPSSTGTKRPSEKLQRLNALVDKIVKWNRQFIRCDTWSVFADENGNAKKEEFPDLLHPNVNGYAKWADALKSIFSKLKLAKPGSTTNK